MGHDASTHRARATQAGLSDVHARDKASDFQTLNFTRPLNDRVGPIVAAISSGRGTFRRRKDPRMSGEEPVRTLLGPISDPVSGSRTCTADSRERFLGHTKQVEIPRVRPKIAFGRREITVAQFFGSGSINELIK